MPTLIGAKSVRTQVAGQPAPAVPTPLQPPVPTGPPGPPGLSAYQTWLAQGNSGTEAQFLAALGGAPPDPGDLTLIFENRLI